jgi:effector-binding domain-containing protein
MKYEVQVKQVPSITTAVVRRRAAQRELPKVIPQCCGEVWTFLRTAGVPNPGRLLALYLDGEINFECGVELFQPFVGNDQVVCSSTPAGLLATVEHIGPYQLLGEAHKAITDWCAANGHSNANPNWEIYGHWNDDPAQLRTDVFYLLKADDAPSQ